MDSREVVEWAWESGDDRRLQNALDPALFELYPLQFDLPPAVFPAGPIPAPDQNAVVEEVAPAQPAATMAPAAHNAGGRDATSQEALDSDIVLAVRVRAKDLTPSEDEDYGHTSDEEVEDEDHGEDKYWSSILFDQKSKSTVLPQPQPPPEHCTVIQAYRAVQTPHDDEEKEDYGYAFGKEVENKDLGEDNWSSNLLDKEYKSTVSQPQPPGYTVIPVTHSEEDQPPGLKAGAVGSTTTPDMSPTLSSTTLQQGQPGAVDVSPAASSITVSELPEDDVPAEAAHVDVLDSPTDNLFGADDASINKLQEEVARPLGSGPHIANPDLALISAMPMTAVTSEDAAGSEVISTRLVSSLDPIQHQEGSIRSTALQKKEEQVISSESSELIFDSTT